MSNELDLSILGYEEEQLLDHVCGLLRKGVESTSFIDPEMRIWDFEIKGNVGRARCEELGIQLSVRPGSMHD